MDWIDKTIHLVNNEPLALLILALGAGLVWMARRLESKDRIIYRLTSALVKAHKEGAELDNHTQMIIGVRKDKRARK